MELVILHYEHNRNAISQLKITQYTINNSFLMLFYIILHYDTLFVVFFW